MNGDAVRELAAEAATVPAWSTPPDDAHEADWRAGYTAAMRDFADRLAFACGEGS